MRDASTGAIVMQQENARFGGWSPDGEWIYLARSEGLFAARVGTRDLVPISTVGVPVSVTKP